tara:strand:- start:1771 stop:1974 length:204 start_codon:yes stop_codon:yes gene_type:complete
MREKDYSLHELSQQFRKNLVGEVREQLQEDIITVVDGTACGNRREKDRLKDRLCEVVCDYFFDKYGV